MIQISDLSGGQIAGIVIGVLLGMVAIVGLVMYLIFGRRVGCPRESTHNASRTSDTIGIGNPGYDKP